MILDDVLALPKVDLHCHLTGTITPSTFGDLARKAKLDLPDEPETICNSICSPPSEVGRYAGAVIPVPTEKAPGEPEKPYSLFLASEWARQALVDDEDFARIAYEAKSGCPVSQALAGVEITLDAALS